MRARTPPNVLTSLGRDGEFLKFWIGQTVSDFGDQITLLALPLPQRILIAVDLGRAILLATIPLAFIFVVESASDAGASTGSSSTEDGPRMPAK